MIKGYIESCLILFFLSCPFSKLLAKSDDSAHDTCKKNGNTCIKAGASGKVSGLSKNSRLIIELSEKIRHEENVWINADKRVLYLEKKLMSAKKFVSDYGLRFINNVRNLNKNDRTLSIVLNSQKEEINKNCKNLACKNEYINKIVQEIEKYKNDKVNVLLHLKELRIKLEKFYENCSKQEPKRLYIDSIKFIVSKANSLEKLLSLISSEVNNGNLKTLPKCKVGNKYVSYPGEFNLSSDFKFDKKDYIAKEIQIRKDGFVFAPITGTVVFISKYANHGIIFGIANSEKGVVLVTGLNKTFVTLGDIVVIGQVIGIAELSAIEDNYSFLKIIAKK